ncbi:hypothetical protein Tco_1483718 [Tanacetum coccineum]
MREKHMRTPSHTSTHLGSVLFRLRDQRPNEERKEARKLIKSYVTCSNTRQREIDRDYHYHDMETSPKKKNDEPSESEDNAGGNRIRMLAIVKTYDDTADPKNHLKNFTNAAKVERWEMPTWCHVRRKCLGNSLQALLSMVKARDDVEKDSPD